MSEVQIAICDYSTRRTTETVTVHGEYYGPFAIHNTLVRDWEAGRWSTDPRRWTVTHVNTGWGVGTRMSTRAKALRLARAMVAMRGLNWSFTSPEAVRRRWKKADFVRVRDRIVELGGQLH